MFATRLATLGAIARAAGAEGFGKMLGLGHGGHGGAHEMEAAAEDSFGGDEMSRIFTAYRSLPVGEAELRSAGWTRHGDTCDPHLGYAWTKRSEGATRREPLKVYTTKGGQPAGVGTIIRKSGLAKSQRKWQTTSPLVQPSPTDEASHLDVAFRSGSILCDGTRDGAAIGTTLILNPKGQAGDRYTIPVTEAEIKDQGWHRGSCFDGMGFHYFMDTAGPTLSRQADNLFPIVAMYHEGRLNAMFFVSIVDQATIPFVAANNWEPVSLSNLNMCKNFCDADCTFEDNGEGDFGTMHIYFDDHKDVKCDASLTCASRFPFVAACCDQDPCDGATGAYCEASIKEVEEESGKRTWLTIGGIAAGVALVGALMGLVVTARRRRQASSAREVGGNELQANLPTSA